MSDTKLTPEKKQIKKLIFKIPSYSNYIFYISLVAMALMLLIKGYDSGFHSDELDLMEYGKNNIAYYKTHGKDTSFLRPSLHDGTKMAATLKYYGSAFEYIANAITTIVVKPNGYTIPTRHILCQLFEIVALFYLGLFVKQCLHKKSYIPSIVAIFIAFFTPYFTGLGIFDIKDMPYATSYIASLYYILLFCEYAHKPKLHITLALVISITFSLSIKLSSVFLLAFLVIGLCIRYVKKNSFQASKMLGLTSITIIGVLAFTLLLWPFLLLAPYSHFMETLNSMRNFPQKIPIRFDGIQSSSLELPPHYLQYSFIYSMPVQLLAILLLGAVLLLFKIRSFDALVLFMLLAPWLIPLYVAISSKMPLYNGWRHFLFLYPSVVATAVCGLCQAIKPLKLKSKALIISFLFLLLMPIAYWTWNHFKLQYMYTNTLPGDYDYVYYNYDTDYWQQTVIPELEWLIQHKIKNRTDSITIATNAFSVCNYYCKKRYPLLKIQFIQIGFGTRHSVHWDYALFSNLFLNQNILTSSFVRESFTLHKSNFNNMPNTIILHDKNRYDYKSITEFNNHHYTEANMYIEKYIQEAKYHEIQFHLEGLDEYITELKFRINDLENAFLWANRVLKNRHDSYIGNLVRGVYLISTKKDIPQGKKILLNVLKTFPDDEVALMYVNRTN